MKQNTPFPFKGSTDEFTLYQSKYGNIVRKRSRKIDKNRIDNDPNLIKTKWNYTEFATAARSSKLIKNAFRKLLIHAKDGETNNRFVALMLRVLKTDKVNSRGQRTVSGGNVALLNRFEFNEEIKLADSVHAPYTSAIDRSSGEVQLEMLALMPREAFKPPKGATHFKFILAAATICFGDMTVAQAEASTAILPISIPAGDLSLIATLPQGSTGVIIAVLGLEFYEQFGTAMSLLTPSALAIVGTSKV
jgi:hypothetical protein